MTPSVSYLNGRIAGVIAVLSYAAATFTVFSFVANAIKWAGVLWRLVLVATNNYRCPGCTRLQPMPTRENDDKQLRLEKNNSDLIDTIKTLTETIARQTKTIAELLEERSRQRTEYAAFKSRLRQSALESVAAKRCLNGPKNATTQSDDTSREEASTQTHYQIPVTVPWDPKPSDIVTERPVSSTSVTTVAATQDSAVSAKNNATAADITAAASDVVDRSFEQRTTGTQKKLDPNAKVENIIAELAKRFVWYLKLNPHNKKLNVLMEKIKSRDFKSISYQELAFVNREAMEIIQKRRCESLVETAAQVLMWTHYNLLFKKKRSNSQRTQHNAASVDEIDGLGPNDVHPRK